MNIYTYTYTYVYTWQSPFNHLCGSSFGPTLPDGATHALRVLLPGQSLSQSNRKGSSAAQRRTDVLLPLAGDLSTLPTFYLSQRWGSCYDAQRPWPPGLLRVRRPASP